jgi:hypothetical protein
VGDPDTAWELGCESYCVDDDGFSVPGIDDKLSMFSTAWGHGNLAVRGGGGGGACL